MQKMEAWGQHGNFWNHWEGFGCYKTIDDTRFQRVIDWRMGDILIEYLKDRVLIVTKDCDKIYGDELAIKKGTFVKESVEARIVPPQWKFVVAYNETKGVIPNHKLKPTKLNCVVTSFVSPLLTVHYRAEHETEQEREDKEDPEKDQEADQEEEKVEDQEESKEENDGVNEEDGDDEESDEDDDEEDEEEDDVDHEEDV